MYPWPNELSPTAFCGLTLEIISFTANTIVFNFNHELLVTVESEVKLTLANKTETITIPPPRTDLVSLVGRSVVDAKVSQDKASLILNFNSGHTMYIDGDDDHYECFQIKTNRGEYVI